MLILSINEYDQVMANGRDITDLYKKGIEGVLAFVHSLFDKGDPEVVLLCRDEVAIRYGFDVGVANIYRYRRNDEGELVLIDS